MDFTGLISSARNSKWALWKLNFILLRAIPFNRPHSIRLLKIEPEEIQVSIPYKRSNLNHIKGIHACGLATACEYASGFLLLSNLNAKDYRIIMESIEMKYHFQAKKHAIATYRLSLDDLKKKVIEPLKKEDQVFIKCEVLCHDSDGNHLCTGYTNWQIKRWDKVRTKL